MMSMLIAGGGDAHGSWDGEIPLPFAAKFMDASCDHSGYGADSYLSTGCSERGMHKNHKEHRMQICTAVFVHDGLY